MNIFGIPIDRIASQESFFGTITQSDRPLVIFTPNPEILLHARRTPSFAGMLVRADYRIPDGIGLLAAAELMRISDRPLVRLLHLPWVAFCTIFRKGDFYVRHGVRICGSDLTHDLVVHAAEQRLGISILDLPNTITDASTADDIRKASCQQSLVETIEQKFP